MALFKETAPSSFGRFNRAFVSMFRIAAGETWIEDLPILDSSGDIFWKSSLFVFSFVILNVWVILQVIGHLLPTEGGRWEGRKMGAWQTSFRMSICLGRVIVSIERREERSRETEGGRNTDSLSISISFCTLFRPQLNPHPSLRIAQVSVAVLLDNFVTASNEMNTVERDCILRERKSLSLFKNPLEPLVLRLASRRAPTCASFSLALPRVSLPTPLSPTFIPSLPPYLPNSCFFPGISLTSPLSLVTRGYF